jgi:magnesium chelatase subunit I
MEFVLHGLASYSMISKKMFESKVEFKDLIGSMMNLGTADYEEEFDEEA